MEKERELRLSMWNCVAPSVQNELVFILFDDFSAELHKTAEKWFYKGFLAMHGLVRGYTTRKELNLTEAQDKIIETVLKHEPLDPTQLEEDDQRFGAGAVLYRGMMPRHIKVE